MNLVDTVATTLFDAADAPGLRQQVTDLTTANALLVAANARLERENQRLQASYEFYYRLHAERQLRVAEDAWGLP